MRPGLTPRLGSGVLVRVLACAPSCFSGWSQRWPPPSASRGKCARDDCCHQPDDFGIPRRNPRRYVDPTACKALLFVQRVEFGYRPNLLPLRQRHRTERVGRPEVLPSGGGWREIPATPHLLFSQFMGESGEQDLAMFMGQGC